MKNKILNKLPRLSLIINDEKSCLDAIKIGGIAAIFSSLSSWYFKYTSFTDASESTLNYVLGSVILMDSPFTIFLFGIYIFRKSRLAATSIFILFIGSRLLLWTATTGTNGLGLSITFLWCYTNAMIGTYIWHSKYKDNIR